MPMPGGMGVYIPMYYPGASETPGSYDTFPQATPKGFPNITPTSHSGGSFTIGPQTTEPSTSSETKDKDLNQKRKLESTNGEAREPVEPNFIERGSPTPTKSEKDPFPDSIKEEKDPSPDSAQETNGEKETK